MNLPKGSRLTRQRRIILDELRKKRAHLTAQQVYVLVRKKLPRISLGTVYRNLKFLQRRGDIAGLLCDYCDCEHFDGYCDHHEHLTCKICKKVYDLNKPIIKTLKITKQGGHQIDDYQLNLIGICKQCLKKSKKNPIK